MTNLQNLRTINVKPKNIDWSFKKHYSKHLSC